MIVTVESFNAYSGNCEDSDEAVMCKKTFLESSEEIVKDYLGFDPEEKEYTEEIDGNLRKGLWLSARNVLELSVKLLRVRPMLPLPSVSINVASLRIESTITEGMSSTLQPAVYVTVKVPCVNGP